jgi:LAS superfamily LD-carboxypeptidase LdcB
MPGTSRHHWGTDIDLVSVDPTYFDSGQGKKIYEWLFSHAREYGFCQVYSNKEETGRTGYSMEKWHWSFMPIANSYLSAYRQLINFSDIKGFSGDKLVSKLDVIEKYVAGLDSACLNR